MLLCLISVHGAAAELIDPSGYASLNIPLGAVTDSPVSFDLIYNSNPSIYSSLAGGWSIPALDSRVVMVNERRIVAFLPSGESDVWGIGDSSIVDSENAGTTNPHVDGQVLRVSKGGDHYVFEKGRLSKWTLRNGDTFEWRGDPVQETGTRKLSLNGREVVEVVRGVSGATGRILIKFLSAGKSTEIVYDEIPDHISEEYVFSGLRSFPTVRKIGFGDGVEVEIAAFQEEQQNSLVFQGLPKHGDLNMVLDPYGVLKRINAVEYETIWMNEQRDSSESGVPLIVARDEVNGEKIIQKGFYYPRRNHKIIFDGVDTVNEYYLDTTTGKRLRKRVVNDEEVYKGYFDGEGRKIRMIENGRVIDIVDGEILVK